MLDTFAPHVAARRAAVLFAGSGIAAVLALVAEGRSVVSTFTALALLDFLIAFGILRIGRERWTTRGLLGVAACSLLVIDLFALAGPVDPYGYPTFFVVLFVWIGVSLPPRTALMLAPLTAVAYAGPLLTAGRPGREVASTIVLVPLLVLLAEVLAHAIAQAKAAGSRLTHEARSDELTGVGNRRHATQLLDALGDGDAVLLIDLDHFKAINDAGGHSAGDRVLAALGGVLRDAVREGDRVARFGGEEFVVVLPSVRDHAARAAERIMDAWREIGPPTTISIGVAVQSGDDPDVTFERADAALYEAKRQGRDRVLVAG